VTSTINVLAGGSSRVFSSLFAAASLSRSASNTMIALRSPSTGLLYAASISSCACSTRIWLSAGSISTTSG
jgi:hypothetical protein